ncbi:hypothetical protein AXF42_Ash010810 [Apostasia shenzhenica]|uniref:Uncharacterized protein n=1 Tax=Apostasia shenzhenica TaxID=1088818 RepID=A0A2I0A0Q6_9ASPA|nr:hypothetical protein AXF42_Ash010810 [Apostasia shenzhenica]
MEVALPTARPPEFIFDSAAASPYATAPSSPRPFGEPFNYHYHYSSAPTSPTRAAALYAHFSSAWEAQEPASPRNGSGGSTGGGELFEFAFDSGKQQGVGEQPLPVISTADELFEKGQIRPLQPPPQPAAAVNNTSGERGRERSSFAASSGNRARESRSLSPLRNQHGYFTKNAAGDAVSGDGGRLPAPSFVKGGGSKKWRLKDLLLFRSASEGRATGRGSRDPLRKYSLLPSFSPFSSLGSSSSKKKGGEDSRNGSFRSTDSGCSFARRSGTPAASAHEVHYTMNRAAAEGQRKKTPLPYHRHGLFSCLQFNPAIRSITRGLSGNTSFSGGRS